MNEATPNRAVRASRLALILLCGAFAAACAGSGGGFGMTRDASNEGRRAFDIDCVGAFAFSPDGRFMASSDGRTLRPRKSPGGRTLDMIDLREGIEVNAGICIGFSSDSRWVAASAHGNMAVKVFDTEEWKEHANYLLEFGSVGAIAFSRDGAEMAIGSTSSMIELCTLATGARRVLRKPHINPGQESAPISFLAYGAGDRTLIANAGGDVIDIDRAQGDILWSRPEERVLAISADARRIVAVSVATGLARLVEITAADETEILCTFQDPAGPSVAETAVFSPDGTWIGVGFNRRFIGANWQELEFYRLAPNTAKPGSEYGGEKLHAEQIRSLRAGEPRRITISSDGKMMCLCTVPIAAIYEVSYLLPKDQL